MQRSPLSGRRSSPALGLGLVLVLVLVDGSRVAAGTGAAPQLLVRIPDPAVSALVQRSVRGAIARLDESERCRALLTDFTTLSGESLAAVLGARGETPGQHLAGLLFLDGSPHPKCRTGAVAAYTAPRWRVVYVCGESFRRRLGHSPRAAEAVVIHETLHTLGLGENPPSARAIQDQVEARCLSKK